MFPGIIKTEEYCRAQAGAGTFHGYVRRVLRAVAATAVLLPVAAGIAAGAPPRFTRAIVRNRVMRAARPANLRRSQAPPVTAKPARVAVSPTDPGALDLLKRMLKPNVEYAGDEVTQRWGKTSRQHVRSDGAGRTLYEYAEPAALNGDVMLVLPAAYRYLHKKSNLMDIALWPMGMEGGDNEKRLLGAIRGGRISVVITGQDAVAGRLARIVEVTGSEASGQFKRKFWIDPATGIKLKQESYSPRGMEASSWFATLVTGPAANVRRSDFDPARIFPANAQTNTLFPSGAQHYNTASEARAAAQFTVLEPVAPTGFRFAGAWVFPLNNSRNSGALLRYTDGVVTFSLYEKPARAQVRAARPPKPVHAAVQRWLINAPAGAIEVIYIGHLDPVQAKAVQDSLH